MAGTDEAERFGERVVGLDIGDGVMVAAAVQQDHRGRLVVTHLAWESYDPASSPRAMADAIRGLWRKAHLSIFTVSACLRGQSIVMKPFRYTGLSGNDLSAALRLEAEESLQTSASQIAMDWHLNQSQGGTANQGGDAVEGILVASPTAEVERYLDVLDRAGLYPVVMDVGCMAVSNAYLQLNPRTAADTGICIVNLGRRLADISILYDGAAIFPRTALSRAADWTQAPDYLAANVQEALKYYEFKLRRDPVEKVFLCGQIPGVEYVGCLAAAVGVPVEAWNPLQGVGKSLRVSRALAGREDQVGPQAAAALGLALRRT